MTIRPTFTDINKANAEIRDMETHMGIMKRMIKVQANRTETLKHTIEVMDKSNNLRKSQLENYIKLMEAWIKLLDNDQVGMVMESMDRIVGNHNKKETI